jgi:hypothetical protein
VTLTFVQLSAFAADWARNRLTDGDLRELESMLLARPAAGSVAAHRQERRVSGRLAYFPRYSHVYFFLLYGKSEQGNLTPDEKRQCRRLVAEVSKLLDERFGSQ